MNGQFGEPQEARVTSYSALQTSRLPTCTILDIHTIKHEPIIKIKNGGMGGGGWGWGGKLSNTCL